MVTITLPGEPQPKQRPRWRLVKGHVTTYTPTETTEYQTYVSTEYMKQHGEMFTDAAVDLNVIFYMSIGRSLPEREKRAIRLGLKRPLKRPDLDNLIKIIMDGLNGVAYDDDKQVVKIIAEKKYSDEPRVVFCLTEHDFTKGD